MARAVEWVALGAITVEAETADEAAEIAANDADLTWNVRHVANATTWESMQPKAWWLKTGGWVALCAIWLISDIFIDWPLIG